jgi:hypothetical protein
MTIYLVIFLPELPYIHRMYMVWANPMSMSYDRKIVYWWFPWQSYRIYAVYIWCWPTLSTKVHKSKALTPGLEQTHVMPSSVSFLWFWLQWWGVTLSLGVRLIGYWLVSASHIKKPKAQKFKVGARCTADEGNTHTDKAQMQVHMRFRATPRNTFQRLAFCLVWITKAFNLGWPLNLWERGKPQNKPSKKGTETCNYGLFALRRRPRILLHLREEQGVRAEQVGELLLEHGRITWVLWAPVAFRASLNE